MIYVKLNRSNFEYDIHSLVKAFFPSEDVLVTAAEKPAKEEVLFRMRVDYIGKEFPPLRKTDEVCGPQADPRDAAEADRTVSRNAGAPQNGCGAAAESGTPGGDRKILLVQDDSSMKSVSGPAGEGSGVCPAQGKAVEGAARAEERTGEVLEAEMKSAGEKEEDRVLFGILDRNGDELRSAQIFTDFADRKTMKVRLKQALYRLLSEYTGKTLPWGTLTGIRPTKIPMRLLEEGKDRAEIVSYMKENYFVSDRKIDLSIEVAEREREILKTIDYRNGYSLYIGIPFCPSTCLYCSFTSFPISAWAGRADAYLDALEKEIRYTAERFRDRELDSIYIGGGTPTTLEPVQLDRLLGMIEEDFDLSHLREVTVEAGRPDSITEEKLKALREHGISRISINPQTMKQETLDLIGRRHTVEQIRDAFYMARRAGFTDINMDLIVGLPEENIEDVRNTMEQIAQLGPDCLTVHSLAVKRAARLRMEKENYQGLHMENTWETIDLTAEYARRMRLAPYYLYRQKNMAGNFENVGYSRSGCEGIYNILIMEDKQTIMAVGAGATTKVVDGDHIERTGNVKDVANYLARTDEMIARKEKLLREFGM